MLHGVVECDCSCLLAGLMPAVCVCVPGVFSGSKGIAEMEAPVRMPAGESLGSMEGLVLRLASDGRAYSFYLRTGPSLRLSRGMLQSMDSCLEEPSCHLLSIEAVVLR